MGMFWGLNMQPNHNYKHVGLKPFHMSGACINKGTSGRLYVKIDGVRHILAHLDSQIHKQVMFNWNFEVCKELIFSFVGDASVTLYGFLLDEPDPEYETDLEEDFKLLNEAFKKGDNSFASGVKEKEKKGDDNLVSNVEQIQSGEQKNDKSAGSSEKSESEEEDEEKDDKNDSEEEEEKKGVENLASDVESIQSGETNQNQI